MDEKALRWFGARKRARLVQCYEMLARELHTTDWEEVYVGLQGVFGLNRQYHFLRQPRSLLDKQHEPQVTRGFRNFLSAGSKSEQVARCQAVFDAIAGQGALHIADVLEIRADDVTRMDLMISALTTENRRCCAVLEAKFGAVLSKSQLRKYEKKAKEYVDDPSLLFLRVVAPTKHIWDQRIMKRRQNKAWTFVSWRAFLLRLQSALPDDGRDTEFTFFKRLVWDRSGGR